MTDDLSVPLSSTFHNGTTATCSLFSLTLTVALPAAIHQVQETFCCELIQRIRDKTAEDNAPKLEAAAKRHKQTIDTKTPQEKQHEAKQNEAGKSFAGNGQYHSC